MTKRAWVMLAMLFASLAMAKLFSLARSTVRSYLLAPAQCASPCHLYSMPLWEEEGGGKPLEAACSPLKLQLELEDARVRAGRRATLWYRATIKNTGCDQVTIHADFLSQGKFSRVDQVQGKGIFFAAYSAGRPVPIFPSYDAPKNLIDGILLLDAGPSSSPSSGDTASDVIPYIVDHTVEEERFSDDGGTTLDPGQSIVNQPTIYYPHKEVLTTVRTNSYVGTGVGWERVYPKRPVARIPPRGFRLLDYLLFRRPGQYDVRLVLDDDVMVYPAIRFDSLTGWKRRLAKGATTILFLDPWVPGRSVHIRAESNSQRVVVIP